MELLTTNNAKTVKGEKYGYKTYIMYLAPHKQNSRGKNLCPNATSGCINACLFSAGHGSMESVVNARTERANLFVENRNAFLFKLYAEILVATTKNEAGKFAIRLNGTSDIPWENIKVMDDKNIFELFPEVTFYDYTKSVSRMLSPLPKNYSLVFSRSEENDGDAIKLLEMGKNVAFVFNKIQSEYKGFEVINGDETDLRFRDKQGVIVGLKYKNITGAGANNRAAFESGFAIKV